MNLFIRRDQSYYSFTVFCIILSPVGYVVMNGREYTSSKFTTMSLESAFCQSVCPTSTSTWYAVVSVYSIDLGIDYIQAKILYRMSPVSTDESQIVRCVDRHEFLALAL